MGKIDRVSSNLFPMPKGAYVRNKQYVYINTSNRYIPSEKTGKGTRGYTDHESVCIGVLEGIGRSDNNRFYANKNYLTMIGKVELPDPPKYADSLSVGLSSWMAEASDQSGLTKSLADSFGDEGTQMILDLAAYMLSHESAVMQHFPAWARDHVLFSDDIRDDTYIGLFLKKFLTVSKINKFKEDWAVKHLGDGRIFLCYDSTNVNSQAEGVFIVERGHAKDDPSLCQVNTDYVIRQSDGLPLTYLHSPGSVTDIAQTPEMVKFISRLKDLSGKDVQLSLICDRGYISETNLKYMDDAGIGYLLMLRTTFKLYDTLSDSVIDIIKSYRYEIQDEDERYGMTQKVTMYEGGPQCYAQVIWSAERYSAKRDSVKEQIANKRTELENFIAANAGTSVALEDLKWIPPYFRLITEPGTPICIEKRKRGRGTGTYIVEKPTVKVIGYEDDEAGINRCYQKSGIIIMITSSEMTAQEANDAYAKRDCVEKTFQALKSHLGMDKIGVSTEEAMHGKGLVWFVASIFHAVLFNKTSSLRASDRKNYTVPAMIDQLEAIKADKNLNTGKRQRRYKLTRKQLKILDLWGINERFIDERISDLSE